MVVPRVDLRLTECGVEEQLDVLQDSDDMAIDIFIKALSIVIIVDK